MKKSKLIVSWIFRVLISLGFIMASLGKLSNDPFVIEMFSNWGYFDGFHLFIGAFEIILAIMLLIPKTLKFAIYGIAIVLTGAIATHLINDPLINLLRPIIFLVLLAGVFLLNFTVPKSSK